MQTISPSTMIAAIARRANTHVIIAQNFSSSLKHVLLVGGAVLSIYESERSAAAGRPDDEPSPAAGLQISS